MAWERRLRGEPLEYESARPRPGSVRVIPPGERESMAGLLVLLVILLVCGGVVVYAWFRITGG